MYLPPLFEDDDDGGGATPLSVDFRYHRFRGFSSCFEIEASTLQMQGRLEIAVTVPISWCESLWTLFESMSSYAL